MNKTLGSSFLIVGVSVGAGVLSLPLIISSTGFTIASILLVISWSVMYFTSLNLVNICKKQPMGVNYTSLLKNKFPKSLQVIFSFIYLLLLYSLMAAYTNQGSELIGTIRFMQSNSIAIDSIFFIAIFGFIILSTRMSDYINRSFVSIKIVFYALCILAMIFVINTNNILRMPISFYAIVFAWPTLLPSFGFQNIIPVIYEYQNGDIKAIRKSILIGSLFVLFIYLIWIFVCLGVYPKWELIVMRVFTKVATLSICLLTKYLITLIANILVLF